MSPSLNIVAFSAALLALGYVFYSRWIKNSLPLPPGPPKLPILGNLLDMPKEYEWLTYHKWSQQYQSDVIHLNIAGQSMIIIDTLDAATELLERRSHIYSSRPQFTMFHELCGWRWNFAFAPYGEFWRQHRRIFHQEFYASAALRFRPQEVKAARALLRRLLDKPEDFIDHLRYMAGQVIMSIAYGIDLQPQNDPYIATAEEALRCVSIAGTPGTFLVDSFPILKNVPAWFPGAGFHARAKEWQKYVAAMVEAPFQATKQQIASGVFTPSVCSSRLSELDSAEDPVAEERLIQETVGTMYTAGADTTVSALSSFFLTMVYFPEVQAKVQQELDEVLGQSVLPDFSDEDSLPYLNATVKEVLRWRPVTPMALPHRLDADDEYKGYHLPSNSVVLANTWAILHDDKVYPEPEQFKPERYLDRAGKLDPTAPDPTDVAFGFGRRVCAARHMAAASVWITVASVLKTFSIHKVVGKDGSPIEPSGKFLSGLVSYTLPFDCEIRPRSSEAEALVRSTEHETEVDF